MNEDQWGWALFLCELVGMTGVYIAGKKVWWGWLVVVAGVSLPWMVYSVSTGKTGFFALTCLWATLNIKNAVQWRRQYKREQEQRTQERLLGSVSQAPIYWQR